MAKKSKVGVSELLKRNRIKRRGRHSKKHKGKRNQNAARDILFNYYFLLEHK
jgi:hypothetical protein